MSGGLREYWELPEINLPEGANGNGEFGQDFRAGLTKVNQDMQVVAVHGAQGEHQTLESNRQTLIKAYQTANSLGDAAKNGQVMGAVAKVGQQSSDKAAKINAGHEEWQKRQSAFDEALVKIGQLEDAGNPKAPAYRKLAEAIQSRADNKSYTDANTAFDQLEPKLNDLITQPDGPTPGLDTGQVQAQQAPNPAPVGIKERIYEDGKKKVFGQGVSTIIIKNYTSKILKKVNAEHGKDVVWIKEPPPQIAAAKSSNDPTTVTITLETNKLFLGAKRGDTSGFATYEFVGTEKKQTVVAKGVKHEKSHSDRVVAPWIRKGDGEIRGGKYMSASGGHEINGHITNKGEFTFEIREIAPKPQTPAAPADTFVEFDEGESGLTSIAKSQLRPFAKEAKAYLAAKGTAKIKVEGYASKVPYVGKKSIELSNENLSSKRAEEVFKYLTEGLAEEEKLPRAKIEWVGKGATSDFDSKIPRPNQRATIKME